MKKVIIIILSVFVLLITSLLIAYPFIEIDTGDALIRCSYSDDFSEYETNQSYNELYCYNEKHDVSIKTFDVKRFLFFYTITMEYIPEISEKLSSSWRKPISMTLLKMQR